MSYAAERHVYAYLDRVNTLVGPLLDGPERTRYVADVRRRIETARHGRSADEVATVKAVRSLGDPGALVAREVRRPPRIGHRPLAPAGGRGPAAPGAAVAPPAPVSAPPPAPGPGPPRPGPAARRPAVSLGAPAPRRPTGGPVPRVTAPAARPRPAPAAALAAGHGPAPGTTPGPVTSPAPWRPTGSGPRRPPPGPGGPRPPAPRTDHYAAGRPGAAVPHPAGSASPDARPARAGAVDVGAVSALVVGALATPILTAVGVVASLRSRLLRGRHKVLIVAAPVAGAGVGVAGVWDEAVPPPAADGSLDLAAIDLPMLAEATLPGMSLGGLVGAVVYVWRLVSASRQAGT